MDEDFCLVCDKPDSECICDICPFCDYETDLCQCEEAHTKAKDPCPFHDKFPAAGACNCSKTDEEMDESSKRGKAREGKKKARGRPPKKKKPAKKKAEAPTTFDPWADVSRRDRGKKARFYCITINTQDWQVIKAALDSCSTKSNVRYIILQREFGHDDDQPYPHTQGYVEFRDQVSPLKVNEQLGIRQFVASESGKRVYAHCCMRFGSQEEAIDYCTINGHCDCDAFAGDCCCPVGECDCVDSTRHAKKECGSVLYVDPTTEPDESKWTNWERGKPSLGQGERTDINEIIEKVDSGVSYRDILRDPDVARTVVRSMSWVKDLYATRDRNALHAPPIELTPKQQAINVLLQAPFRPNGMRAVVHWIWSLLSGTGKSTFRDWLAANYVCSFGAAKWEDTVCAFNSVLLAKGKVDLLIWDISRQTTIEKLKKEYIPQIEKASDGGPVCQPKYQSANIIMQAHVVVLSNINPHPLVRAAMPNRVMGHMLDKVDAKETRPDLDTVQPAEEKEVYAEQMQRYADTQAEWDNPDSDNHVPAAIETKSHTSEIDLTVYVAMLSALPKDKVKALLGARFDEYEAAYNLQQQIKRTASEMKRSSSEMKFTDEEQAILKEARSVENGSSSSSKWTQAHYDKRKEISSQLSNKHKDWGVDKLLLETHRRWRDWMADVEEALRQGPKPLNFHVCSRCKRNIPVEISLKHAMYCK